ncbi:MAG TPA: DUF5668 domain-containing protein [Anaerolineae bacterium]|nr:DUF5668 domain-containing protein [Anaerolineae bacterium]
MSVRLLRWGTLIGGSLLVALGVLLLLDQAHTLPPFVWQYWPVVLIAWGLWKWGQRLRAKEDRWAGPDYGTGLYVIRHRRRQASGWLPGLFLILLGSFLLWTTLDPLAGFSLSPIVLIVLGLFQVWRGFRPPPRTDFYAAW